MAMLARSRRKWQNREQPRDYLMIDARVPHRWSPPAMRGGNGAVLRRRSGER